MKEKQINELKNSKKLFEKVFPIRDEEGCELYKRDLVKNIDKNISRSNITYFKEMNTLTEEDEDDFLLLDYEKLTWFSEKYQFKGSILDAIAISKGITTYENLKLNSLSLEDKVKVLKLIELEYDFEISIYKCLEEVFSFMNQDELNSTKIILESIFWQLEEEMNKEKSSKETIEYLKEQIEDEFSKFVLKELRLKVIPSDNKPEMFYYKEGMYCENAEFIVKSLASYLMEKNVHKISLSKIMKHIATIPIVSQEEFFEQPEYKLCVNNGFLNLKNKKLTSLIHSTDDEFHHIKLDWDYNRKAKCPNFEKFLNSLLEESDVKLLQEFIGFCLVKGYPFEAFMIFLGEGKNGKSTLLTILRHFFSMRNITGLSINAFSDSSEDSFIFGSLNRKLLNIAGDAGTKPITGDEIKKLTGNDPIYVNRKFKEPITIVNTSKFITSFNELPYVKDNSDGFWRRCLFIQFKFRFHTLKEFEKLKEKTQFDKIADKDLIKGIINNPEEFSGILNWALEGLERLENQKGFSKNESTEDIQNRWNRESNSFYAFVEEYTEHDRKSSKKLFRSQLLNAYREFCEVEGLKPITHDTKIKIVLDKKGIITDPSNRSFNGLQREYYYEGLKLKNPYDKFNELPKVQNGEFEIKF